MEYQSYFSFGFFLYLLRWIFSAFIMMIPLYFINRFKITEKFKYKEYIDLIIVQIIGAFIFWWIDQLIFKGG